MREQARISVLEEIPPYMEPDIQPGSRTPFWDPVRKDGAIPSPPPLPSPLTQPPSLPPPPPKPKTKTKTKPKPHKCNICTVAFQRPSALKIHRLSHTGEKRAYLV